MTTNNNARLAQAPFFPDTKASAAHQEDDATRGFIATWPNAEVRDANGRVVWTLAGYEFLQDEVAAPTVHPGLWEQARRNMHHGLFEVTERIYQVRGFDLANMTIIEGDKGVIIIDPLTCAETAAAALKLYREQRGERPVTAVIYSHSHVDHFGGVRGVIDEEHAIRNNIPIIAPAGFLWHTVAENMIAGNAMSRRSQFQFGSTLQRGVCAQVDCGLGKTLPHGTITLIPPTRTIEKDRETHVIDGIEIVFALAPESEAPSEMFFFFPQLRALNLAELGQHTMHNLCPLRGAQVRDARLWSRYLDEALHEFAPHADVVYAQHNWPTWGQEKLTQFIAQQRDLYKYVHDQTVRLMNKGQTAIEIAEELRLPPSLAQVTHAQGYYGALVHNVKAVVQHYLGWYDGNPSRLHTLPPVEAGSRYIDYMGGADALLARAQKDFARGEHRWVAEVLSHLVFADPANHAARQLCAASLEQLGFEAESSTWRNAYVLAARELREGVPKAKRRSMSYDLLKAVPMEMFLDCLAIRLVAERAQGQSMQIGWHITDADEHWVLTLGNAALTYRRMESGADADATIAVTRERLVGLLAHDSGVASAIAHGLESGDVAATGDVACVKALMSMLDEFDPMFNVVEP
ncbi:alkyl sulfatase dimerization domain-containing protein [Variovorax sp. J22R133]|uniref:alkyl/aryl-sulfatase n=1 Tax=Variovorax brevis TaxID=3053503 RepID=UPI002576A9DB|nr:alkyl sulfatase dimerization domain-containing protein [Variovorax sp. J22R133]MDM0112066.1 alkyl sulfatase dimerization domain-containing protein [Variovorax sp. J22R133]